MTAQSGNKENDMTTFTIDAEKHIVAFASREEAAAATTTPFDSFGSEQELAELAAAWPAERFVEIWNSLAGVAPIKKFKNSKTAISRIWARIQSLGDTAKPAPEQAAPKAPTKAKGRAQVAHVAPAKAKATKRTTTAKNAPRGKKAPAPDAIGPREGSKKAQVAAMLQRKGGATLAEIMEKMGWQRHTVRGFMAGAMKKAGYTVESYKNGQDERAYRIVK
jgi:hypothetical protein